MPAPAAHHPLLSAMTPEQLGIAARGLDSARSQYESLSGACSTLAGLVLIEAKQRLGHGHYMPWLKSHLGKSAKTASQYVAVAKGFLKFYPRVKFEQLTLALMDGAQATSGESLDMTNPMVSAVAGWTKGRTFYELKQEFVPTKGGKTYERDANKGKAKKTTAEQAAQISRDLCLNAAQTLAAIHKDTAYTVLNDAELDGLIDHCAEVHKTALAWRKLTKAQRAAALAERLANTK